jgi:hypothetical protein
MTKKNWLSVILLVALVAVYAIYFTDWFKPKTVRVFHTVREMHRRNQTADAEAVLLFGLGTQLKLTEIKVVPLAGFQADPKVQPVWHLVSDSNSVPLKEFSYGRRIRGMKPAVPGTEADLLETNVTYRIFVAAGRIKGQHDFELGGTPTQNTATDENQ